MIKKIPTDAKGEGVGNGSDGDRNGRVLQGQGHALFCAQTTASVSPRRHQDKHVVHTDTCTGSMIDLSLCFCFN